MSLVQLQSCPLPPPPVSVDDTQGQTESKVPSNQALTSTASLVPTCQCESPKVPDADKSNAIRERRADKLDNKLSDKPDPDLARIIAAWPNLADHIKAAIVALVKTV